MTPTARDVALAPLQAEGAVEQIVRRLGEAIGAGVLAPGERLPSELELAAQLGVAPMTLRQALQILRAAGFVETRRGRTGGSFVRDDPPAALVLSGEPPTRSALRELTDWRRAISGEAAALAAERAGRPGAGSRRAAAAAERAVGAFAGFRLADARFHIAVAEASGSRRLVAAETQIQVEIAEMLRVVPGPRLARAVSQASHDPIVAAIAEGDARGRPHGDGAPRRGHLRLDRGPPPAAWPAPEAVAQISDPHVGLEGGSLPRSRVPVASTGAYGRHSANPGGAMRKPSAALVVATAALVMSTIGTSVAATQFVITSPKQVKPGTITLSALTKQARKALRGERGLRGRAGASGPQGPVGAAGIPGLSATKLWAQIGSDASVNVSTPGVTARLGVSPGTYAVNFGVDITRCAATATQGSIPPSAPGCATAGIPGAALVFLQGAGAELAPGFPTVSTVLVETTNGTAGGTAAPSAFTIAVLCG